MELLRKHLLHLCRVPRDLDSVTCIDSKQEVDPREVGMRQADVDAIWGNIVKLYKSGVHPGHQYQHSPPG